MKKEHFYEWKGPISLENFILVYRYMYEYKKQNEKITQWKEFHPIARPSGVGSIFHLWKFLKAFSSGLSKNIAEWRFRFFFDCELNEGRVIDSCAARCGTQLQKITWAESYRSTFLCIEILYFKILLMLYVTFMWAFSLNFRPLILVIISKYAIYLKKRRLLNIQL